jgi:hypothetical protein
MPEHKLEPGREIIAALLNLGGALGYVVQPEYELPNSDAAVDVAWLREPGQPPLIIFEVESRPTAGLAANAIKVLGRDSAETVKPLHFFHLVMEGGARSRRPSDVTREYAAHNYSLHLLSQPGEPQRLLQDVLRVHRRVTSRVDGVDLAIALAERPWPSESTEPFLRFAEELGFSGMSERAYVVLARYARFFEPSLTRKLRALWQLELAGQAEPPNRDLEPPQKREEPYGSYMAAAACEALELGLIAQTSNSDAERAFDVLQRWQELNHIGDIPGPFTGSGSQWTEYAVGQLGFFWALVAALFARVPGARAWCGAQPASLLEHVYDGDAPDIALLALWVMHICAGEPGCEATYERARARLARDGGVSVAWLVSPEPATPGADGDWSGVSPAGEDVKVAPDAAELLQLVGRLGNEPGNAAQLALDALLEDPAYRPQAGGALVALLAGQRMTTVA